MPEMDKLFHTVEAYQSITIHYLTVSPFRHVLPSSGEFRQSYHQFCLFPRPFPTFLHDFLRWMREPSPFTFAMSVSVSSLFFAIPSCVGFIFLSFLSFFWRTSRFLCSVLNFSLRFPHTLFLWIGYGHTVLPWRTV